MKDILIATYKREDTYKGHSKINHYHIPTEIRCYICNNSEERTMGIIVNGKPCPDYFDIIEYNYQGKAIYRHHFTDRDSANNCFKAIIKNGGFKKAEWHRFGGGNATKEGKK